MVEDLDADMDQLLLSPSGVGTDPGGRDPPRAASASDVFGRSLSNEIDRLFLPSPSSSGHLNVISSGPGQPQQGGAFQEGTIPASAAEPTTSTGTPTLDFDSLWSVSQFGGGGIDTMGSNAVDMLLPSPSSAGGPAATTASATLDGSDGWFGMDTSATSATQHEAEAEAEEEAGWIMPYDPRLAAAAANPERAIAVAPVAGPIIDPYDDASTAAAATTAATAAFDPESAVNWSAQAAKALEWVGPTGAHEFDAWEAKAKQMAIDCPPTSIATITDEQMAYTDLKVILELARRAHYTPAQIQQLKKDRRKCKNRLSAKGSASKRRVQMSGVAETNKKLCAVVVGLRSQNETLARTNAELEASVRGLAEEQARADAQRDRFQAEIDRLLEMVKAAELGQQRATMHGDQHQHQPMVTSA